MVKMERGVVGDKGSSEEQKHWAWCGQDDIDDTMWRPNTAAVQRPACKLKLITVQVVEGCRCAENELGPVTTTAVPAAALTGPATSALGLLSIGPGLHTF